MWPEVSCLALEDLLVVRECAVGAQGRLVGSFKEWQECVVRAASFEARVALLAHTREAPLPVGKTVEQCFDEVSVAVRAAFRQLVAEERVRNQPGAEDVSYVPLDALRNHLITNYIDELDLANIPIDILDYIGLNEPGTAPSVKSPSPAAPTPADDDVNNTLANLLAFVEPDRQATKQQRWREKIAAMPAREAELIMSDRSDGTLNWLKEKTDLAIESETIRSRTQGMLMCRVCDALESLWMLSLDDREESDSMFVFDQLEQAAGNAAVNVLLDCVPYTEKLVTHLAVAKRFIKQVDPSTASSRSNVCTTCSNGLVEDNLVINASRVQREKAAAATAEGVLAKMKQKLRGNGSFMSVLDSPNLAILLTLEMLDFSPRDRTTAGSPKAGMSNSSEPTLPEGTVKRDEKDFLEYVIPPQSKLQDASLANESLVPVASLPDWCQTVLYGIKNLNRIQSKVMPKALNTDENLLICAPTGAGKTNVALLCIMQALSVHIESFGMAPAATDFKVVYIAPLKSLVTEIANKFADRLGQLGMKVAELTGDMSLTKAEIDRIHVIVTVPEKWDVQTRNARDAAFGPLKLLIIDEVHLVGEERGSVLEATIARSFSYMAEAQTRHRIVALSATLPNYADVGLFLEVQRDNIFVFADECRPIPLRQTIVGLRSRNPSEHAANLIKTTYDKMIVTLTAKKQVMVFVHSRNDTVKTAEALMLRCQEEGTLSLVVQENHKVFSSDAAKIQHTSLRALVLNGFAIHHAGLSRSDRRHVETMFAKGLVGVLCTTATLAWGVNLPAHQVIIKGTDVFGARNKELGILDVLQIFGRAGRPDFDVMGDAVLLTDINRQQHYLKQLLRQTPLESSLQQSMPDHLNAEIVLGNITDLRGAAKWIRHTFMFLRMRRNPIHYGITAQQLSRDSSLFESRMLFAQQAVKLLNDHHLVRCSAHAGNYTLSATGLGRVACRFYVSHDTIHLFDKALDKGPLVDHPDANAVLKLVSSAKEFETLRVREEEVDELSKYRTRAPVTIHGPIDDINVKVSLLVLMWLEEIWPQAFSLGTDMNFIVQSYGRLLRAFAEICFIRQVGTSAISLVVLEWAKALQTRVLPSECPLAHFVKSSDSGRQKQRRNTFVISPAAVRSLQDMDLLDLLEADVSELTYRTRTPADGRAAFEYTRKIPYFDLQCGIVPITSCIVTVTLKVLPVFEWSQKYHTKAEVVRVALVNPLTKDILHHEDIAITADNVTIVPRVMIPGRAGRSDGRGKTVDKQAIWDDCAIQVKFSVPLREPRPPQYVIHVISDRWVGSYNSVIFELDNLMMPSYHQHHTNLLPLNPMPIEALKNEQFQSLYKFRFFNPIQSQVFYCMYKTDESALVGAPTGSGKTICGELALLRLFAEQPKLKCVYIAPLKALGKERLKDWSVRLANIGKRVVELSGDVTPDMRVLKKADVIITTPEKWDGISRHWQHRSYVQQIGLMIIDEIHLLGADRGPILEMIVSRTRHISMVCNNGSTRFVGLSTALANAVDIAKWLGVSKRCLFNFRPSVRPVPCNIYVQGFSETAYCKRMAQMNKPTFNAILAHSPQKPVLVFVSSRRQVRLTGKELVFLSRTHDPVVRFLQIPTEEQLLYEKRIDDLVEDGDLRECLKNGVALHHAGLSVSDRQMSEQLFAKGDVQILVSTSTLAWGVNLPAHLVIIKGTVYYDGKTCKYIDTPLTEVLQMIGRAGRPQYDTEATACVFLHESKKQFYRRFLYEPFPVESSLHLHLTDHLNAEIVSGTVTTKKEAVEFLSWTYFFRRVVNNISYYDDEFTSQELLQTQTDLKLRTQYLKEQVAGYLDRLLCRTITKLQEAGCIDVVVKELDDKLDFIDRADISYSSRVQLKPTGLGKVASRFYVTHQTVALMASRLSVNMRFDFYTVLRLICDTPEMSYTPVRHSEDETNLQWNRSMLPIPLDTARITSGTEKALALFQMQMWRLKPPVHDYNIDVVGVCASAMRVIQACANVCLEVGCWSGWTSLLLVLQCLTQGTNPFRSSLYCLPHITKPRHYNTLRRLGIEHVAQLLFTKDVAGLRRELMLRGRFTEAQWNEFDEVVRRLPRPQLRVEVWMGENGEWRQLESVGEDVYCVRAGSEVCVQIRRSDHRGWAALDLGEAAVHADSDVAFCPRWPRERVLSWWYGLGDVEADELVQMSKASGREVQLRFVTPTDVPESHLRLLVAPDCYAGLNQRLDLTFFYEE